MTYKTLTKIFGISFIVAAIFFVLAAFSLDRSKTVENKELHLIAEKFFGESSEKTKYFEESISLDLLATRDLSIESVSTDIEIVQTNGAQTTINFKGWAIPQIDANGLEKPWVRVSDSSEERISFDRKGGESFRFSFRETDRKDQQIIRIELGRDARQNLNAETVSGEIKIADIHLKNIRIASTSGDIQVSGSISKASLKSTSGEIESKLDAQEELKADTVSGDIKVFVGAHLKGAEIESISGDIAIEAVQSVVPNINFRTTSGEVQNPKSWPLDFKGVSEKILLGSPKASSPSIKIKTVSGDLSL